MTTNALFREFERFLGWWLIGFLSLIMFTNLPLWLGRAEIYTTPVTFDVVLVSIWVPFVLLSNRYWKPFLLHPFSWWCFLFIGMHWLNLPRVGTQDFLIDLDDQLIEINRTQRTLLLLIYAYVTFVMARGKFHRFLTFATVAVSALVILDFFAPDLVNPTAALGSGRAEGTFQNANVAAEAMIVGLILIYRKLTTPVLALILVLVGIGEITTFSRSGMVSVALVTIFLFSSKRFPKWFLIAPLALVLSYTTLLTYAEDVLSEIFSNRNRVENLVDRLSFFETSSIEEVDDDSTEARQEIAGSVFKDSLSKPLLGYGIAPYVSYGVAAHNLPLEYWYTYGVLGVVLWVWMLYMLSQYVGNRLFGLVSLESVIFLWFSFFNHTQFESNFWFLFFGLTIMGSRKTISAMPNIDKMKSGEPTARLNRRRRKVASSGWKGRFG